jgi:hypothetical protein
MRAMIVVRLDVVREEKDSADVCNPIARIAVCDEGPVDLKLASVNGFEVLQ